MDVVTGHPDDFASHIADGRLFGRGTHDMKFAIATYIALMQELGKSLVDYDLGLMLTCDEELGGDLGVGWLVNERGYRGGAVLLPDSSSNWKIEVGGKGIMCWNLQSQGRTTHASRPWQGVNAIDQLYKFIDLVKAKFPAEPCPDPQHRHASMSLSTISGGGSVNQVPGTATARIDVRFTPDVDPGTIKSWFNEAMAKMPGVEADAYRIDMPYKVAPSTPGKRLHAIAAEVLGREVEDHMATGSSDARWFAWKGVPTINIGIGGSGYHVSPEWVSIPDLEQFYEVTRRFVDDWARS
jgi:succinyl-diaminopimelate desuccinylase